jgi:hypothetical protein
MGGDWGGEKSETNAIRDDELSIEVLVWTGNDSGLDDSISILCLCQLQLSHFLLP